MTLVIGCFIIVEQLVNWKLYNSRPSFFQFLSPPIKWKQLENW
jgi:hypothetical protein